MADSKRDTTHEDPRRASADYLDNRTHESEVRHVNSASRSEAAVGPAHEREGTAPSTSANPGPGRKGGDIRHVANTGLPPGVNEKDLWDPGTHNREDRDHGPAKNRS
jgi:hypothetical protein